MPYLHLRLIFKLGRWELFRTVDSGAWLVRVRGGSLHVLWGRRHLTG